MQEVEYVDDVSGLTPEDLVGFFEGWPNPPSSETHLQILRASYAAVLARDASSHQVIGFGTAISDGTLAAYLSLLEVRPEYRKRGIGSEIVRRLMARLSELYMVDVVCDDALEPFYARLGLTPARAMVRRNYSAQSGLRLDAARQASPRAPWDAAAPAPSSPRSGAASISLHPPNDADAEAVLEAVRESVADLEPWMSWCTPRYSLEDARRWTLDNGKARVEGTAFAFLIRAESARLLGVVGLNQIDHANGFANLGYWVRSSEAGRGIAAAAVRRLEEWAFAETALRRLELVIAVGNARSQRVAEKVGATFEGVLRGRLRHHGVSRDAFMYSLVKLPSG